MPSLAETLGITDPTIIAASVSESHASPTWRAVMAASYRQFLEHEADHSANKKETEMKITNMPALPALEAAIEHLAIFGVTPAEATERLMLTDSQLTFESAADQVSRAREHALGKVQSVAMDLLGEDIEDTSTRLRAADPSLSRSSSMDAAFVIREHARAALRGVF